jgi:hypothetical protein
LEHFQCEAAPLSPLLSPPLSSPAGQHTTGADWHVQHPTSVPSTLQGCWSHESAPWLWHMGPPPQWEGPRVLIGESSTPRASPPLSWGAVSSAILYCGVLIGESSTPGGGRRRTGGADRANQHPPPYVGMRYRMVLGYVPVVVQTYTKFLKLF